MFEKQKKLQINLELDLQFIKLFIVKNYNI